MSLDTVLHLLQSYGYFLLFPISVLEGPIVTVLAGFLVTLKVFNPIAVFVIVVLGDIAGDAGLYLLGRIGGRRVALKYGRWAGVNEKNLKKANDLFEGHKTKAVALSKFVHGVGFAGFIAAGILRIPYRKLFFTGLVLSMLQDAVFLAIGIAFGSAYVRIGRYFNYFATGCIIAVAIGVIAYFVHKKFKRV